MLTAAGGAERSHSVRNALAALAPRAAAEDWVLVHDAARPCLPATDLERLLGTLDSHRLGGLLAVPAADSVWPIIDLLEETGIRAARSPNSAAIPIHSILSFSGVPVPCGLM